MDKTKSCEGCPDRVPGCHASCEGYALRRAKSLEKQAGRIARGKIREDLAVATGIVKTRAIKKQKKA